MSRSLAGSAIWALLIAACVPAPPTAVTATLRPTPTAIVAPLAAVTPTQHPSSLPDAELAAKLDAMLTSLEVNLSLSGSVLVARQGRILLNKGYGLADRQKQIRNAAQTQFRIASITKQFTAAAILILQARGKLHVEDRACLYLGDCPAAWKSITLHELLTHTSGIMEYKDLPDYADFRATPAAPAEVTGRFSDLPLLAEPGKEFRYSNSGYFVLGRVIESVSGMAYEDFIRENILLPLGMMDTGLVHTAKALALGYANSFDLTPAAIGDATVDYSAGGLYATPGDLYRFDLGLSEDKLLPEALRLKMLTPYELMPDSGGLSYGYGCQVKNMEGHPLVGHTGILEGYSAMNMYFPDDKVAVILLGNQRNPPLYGIGIQLAYMVLKPVY